MKWQGKSDKIEQIFRKDIKIEGQKILTAEAIKVVIK